jgi:hypothetical protein
MRALIVATQGVGDIYPMVPLARPSPTRGMTFSGRCRRTRFSHAG